MEERSLLRMIPGVHAACNTVGLNLTLLAPYTREVRQGLVEVAFAFEDPRFTESAEQVVRMVFDGLEMTIGSLADAERAAEAKEKTLGFKVKRVLRPFFGFPVYVVGFVLGFDPSELPDPKARLAMVSSFLASCAAGVTIVFQAGMKLGWWR